MSWSEHIVKREGVRLACRDRGGSGTPVVLLHGLAGHAGEWDGIAGRLAADGHRVVAFDQRGHGASERHPADVSRAAYVADVLAVVAALGLHRPVLLGQSLGGHTALLTAAARPDLIRALVVVEAGPERRPGAAAEIGAALFGWPLPFPSFAAAVAFFGGGPVGEAWAAGLEERDGGWWTRFDPEVMTGSLAENEERAHWDEWAGLSCPTLAVWGQSGIVPASEVDPMLALRPGITAASVPGAGHDVHLEAPEALWQVLRPFLAGLPA
ncbi:alpha/beta hydrolase [Streptomyces bambusae]|uniref:alpha/beta fold hydrolase n=1 Tax=Streptomyces bambusae TaxID=1550616 RepID=UPI001CFC7E36|nr:alpha/beta hydrolase [Streptomyces bambusae]MCB5167738.1 alpha/beta hydrolase [Streptomyces bambusae]